jgi:hypothetical protein
MGKNKQNQGGQCRGKTKKGGKCPNPAEQGGFCGHHQSQMQKNGGGKGDSQQKNKNKNQQQWNQQNHQQKGKQKFQQQQENHVKKQNYFEQQENHVKKQNYFAGQMINPVQRQFQEQLSALNKTQERQQRLSDFMMRYGISGSSRVDIVKVLVDCPLSYLRRIVSENGLSVDLQQDKIQIAVDIVTNVELPDQGNSIFAGIRLQQTIVKDQFFKSADKFKANISHTNQELQKLIVSSALNWCTFASAGNGYLPLINRLQMESVWMNSLGSLFSGLDAIFKIDCIPTAMPNLFEVTIWLSNYVSKSEWESFFTFTLTECRDKLMKASNLMDMEPTPVKRKKENVENELGFGWNLF